MEEKRRIPKFLAGKRCKGNNEEWSLKQGKPKRRAPEGSLLKSLSGKGSKMILHR